jgi:hypothetical protein
MSNWCKPGSSGKRWRLGSMLAAIVAVTPPWLAAQDPVVTERASEDPALATSIREYEDLVNRTEIDEGAFAPVLAEQLVTLGTLLQRNQRHEQAIAILQRALHVARVNFGLYEPRNAAIVDRMIESHLALKDWKAANSDHGYWIWLQRRGQEAEVALQPGIYARYGQWQLDAADLDTGINPFSHLATADAAFTRAVEGYEKEPEASRDDLIAALYALAYTNLRIYQFVLSNEDAKSGILIQDAQLGEQLSGQSLEMMRRSDLSFRHGRDALSRAAALTEQTGDPAATATAYTYLGDWMLLFGRYREAQQLYRQAEATAATAPQPEELHRQLFDSPTLLPALPIAVTEYYPESVNTEDYVLLSVDVSERGEVTRTRVIEQTSGVTDVNAYDAKKYLRIKRLRPRLVNGNMQTATDVRLRYFPRGGAVRVRP